MNGIEVFDTQFEAFKRQIEEESKNKTLIQELEKSFYDELKVPKKTLLEQCSLPPKELKVIFGAPVELHSLSMAETIGAIYKKYVEGLEIITSVTIQKEQSLRKVREESVYYLLLDAYLNRVSMHMGRISRSPTTVKVQIFPTMFHQMGLLYSDRELRFYMNEVTLDYSTYLMALLRLTDTIVDYTTNCVIKDSITYENDPTEESKIAFTIALVNLKLLEKLQIGYQSLDLKNDGLRRKYDGLKYSVKKLNEIVYDLSVRRMIVRDCDLVDTIKKGDDY